MKHRQPGAYLRFGDGDICLLHGQPDMMQTPHPHLQLEMREAFRLAGPGILKCLPLHSNKFGMCPGMVDGAFLSNDDWATAELAKCFEYFIGDHIYSHVALAYLSVFEPSLAQRFLTELKATNPIFVGNENASPHVLRALFGDTPHVPTPSRCAYQELDRIEGQLLQEIRRRGKHFQVVVVATGCTGRVLQKRMLNQTRSVFYFDFGSLLDALCGEQTRAWMEVLAVPAVHWQRLLDAVSNSSHNGRSQPSTIGQTTATP